MNVVLIHPPHPNSTDDRLDPPMGLLYIASHIKKNNIDVQVCDLSGKSTFDIPFANIYGITVYISSLELTKDIIKKCKVINPKCKIVVGGAHPSACPNDFTYADHVVVGYGESAMVNIVTGIETNKIVIGTEPNDQFLFPSYDLVDINSYHRRIDGKQSLSYLTSRGCPFKCSFCGLNKMHKLGFGVRMMEPDVVYSQIKKIVDDFGINAINFQDDIFTFNPKRLFKILDLIRPLKLKFRCMGRAGYDTEEVYEKLAESGCIQVAWGIESGSQYILNRMRKQVKVEDNYNVIQWAKKYGITSRAFFIIGFPGETRDTLEETKQFIIDSDPDQCFVSSFIPYPGTEVGDDPVRFGITNVSDDFNQYYQVGKDGTGGITIDTKWLSKCEFRELELDFRKWLHTKPMRGQLQDYEIKMEESLNEKN